MNAGPRTGLWPLAIVALLAGCATTRPHATRTIFSKGAFYVKLVELRAPDGEPALTFDHPVDFAPDDIMFILGTLRASKRKGVGWTPPEPVLSRPMARLLAPHLARAFSEAGHTEYVAFKATQRVPGFLFSKLEVTAGTMFLRDDELHVQLEHFKTRADEVDRITYRPDRAGTEGGIRLEPGEGMRRVAVPDSDRVYNHWIAADWPALQAKLAARRTARARSAAAQERQRAGEEGRSRPGQADWEAFEDDDVRFSDEGDWAPVPKDRVGAADEAEPVEARLRRLDDLRERGLISTEEYEQKRREILDEL